MAVHPRTLANLPLALLAAVLVSTPVLAQNDDGWRTIEIETTEVTAPDVAITPDGESLIITLLGHLFRLPVEGGEAEQLTFGPYFDARPAVSPDGSLVAFQSDRDGSEGNIFLLELATGEFTQLTDESWADRPTWSPDGQSVVYLRLVREAWNASDTGPDRNPRRTGPPAIVRRVGLDGDQPETLRSEVSEVRSPFHLGDGRVGWAVVQRDPASPRATTRIEVLDADGPASTVRVLAGVVDAIVASDRALFARRYLPLGMRHELPQQHEVVRVPFGEGLERPVMPVSDISGYNPRGEPLFAQSGRAGALYVGNLGRLWRVNPEEGERESIPFRATVTMEVRDPVPPPRWTIPEPGVSAAPHVIGFPRLSPDGQRLVFRAGGQLWEQPLDGGPIRRLSDVGGIGVAFSPDGSRIAFFAGQELRVFDFSTGETQVVEALERGNAIRPRVDPSWTLGGEGLIGWENLDADRARLLVIRIDDGTKQTLAEVARHPDGHTTVSADGQWLYFLQGEGSSADPTTVVRLSLGEPSAPAESQTELALDFERGRVSPDGQWFFYRPDNRMAIRAVPLGTDRVSAEDSRLVSPVGSDGGRSFGFDGSSVVYAGPGSRVWRQPVSGGEAEEIPVRLELERPTPPPVLLRRVRVLDYTEGGFSAETAMLIEEGRIAWIGSEQEQLIPPGTQIHDAGGRFAIPGLFDMHGHAGGCARSAYVEFGVTSVRNIGGRAEWAGRDADRSVFTGDPVPRCFSSGYLLEGEQGRNGNSLFIHPTDELDIRAQVRLMHALGARFIKLYHVLPWPLHRAAADEARQLGLPVVAHGANPEQVVKGVTLGYLLTHGALWNHADLSRLLAVVGMRTDPTLGVAGAGQHVLRLREPDRFPGSQRIDPVGDNALSGFWARRLASVRRAYQLGVTLLPGTDWAPSGWTLQVELEFFAEAGIPPLDILRFATQAAAETVGAGDELGTLEVGKLADIVLLDANPLEDIKNTQAIWRVIKGGFVFDPDELRPEN